MAELRIERVEIYEVVEQGYGGRKVVHAAFSTREEADRRHRELLARQPALATPGVLWVGGRSLEVPRETSTFVEKSEPPTVKMRRAGRDYEDKAVSPIGDTGREQAR